MLNKAFAIGTLPTEQAISIAVMPRALRCSNKDRACYVFTII